MPTQYIATQVDTTSGSQRPVEITPIVPAVAGDEGKRLGVNDDLSVSWQDRGRYYIPAANEAANFYEDMIEINALGLAFNVSVDDRFQTGNGFVIASLGMLQTGDTTGVLTQSGYIGGVWNQLHLNSADITAANPYGSTAAQTYTRLERAKYSILSQTDTAADVALIEITPTRLFIGGSAGGASVEIGKSDHSDNVTITGTNIAIGTSTTLDKIGLYGVTPVAQAAALTASVGNATTAQTQAATLFGAATNTTPFGFGSAAEVNWLSRLVVNMQTRINEIEAALGSSTGIGVIA